jgi:hypothetical protein
MKRQGRGAWRRKQDPECLARAAVEFTEVSIAQGPGGLSAARQGFVRNVCDSFCPSAREPFRSCRR